MDTNTNFVMIPPTTPKKRGWKGVTAQVVGAIAVIAVLAGITWVGTRSFAVLPNARQLLANAVVSIQSVFSPAERIVLSIVDSQVVVDEPFTLTWEHRGTKDDGSYTFFYECRDGVHLALDGTTVFCNTELPLLDTDTSLKLIARGDVIGIVGIPVEIRFRKNDSERINERGKLTVSVQDERLDDATATSTAPPTTNVPTTPVAGTPITQTIPVVIQPFSDPNGEADLTIRVIAYGLVDKNSGAFTEEDEIPRNLPSNKRGAIKFVVENIGTKLSGEWQFKAALPTTPSYTYTSKDQDSLYPGDKIEFVIGFDRIKNADEDDYRIEVDPSDDIDESRENNNVVNGTIEIDR